MIAWPGARLPPSLPPGLPPGLSPGLPPGLSPGLSPSLPPSLSRRRRPGPAAPPAAGAERRYADRRIDSLNTVSMASRRRTALTGLLT